MGSLYIDKRGYHIKLDGNAMAFYLNGKREGVIPIEPIERVVFVGKMTIDTNVIKRLALKGISVIFLSGRTMAFWGRISGRMHNNAILRVKQYEKLKDQFALKLSQDIVQRKISSQIDLIEEVIKEREELKFFGKNATEILERFKNSIEKYSDISSLNGIEGSASSVYFDFFRRLFPPSLSFKRRIRRPPTDPVNSMLSLSYTMLHYEVLRELEILGLDPFVGFYHQFEYGRESLACDFVELFRTRADRFVYELFRKGEFKERNFSKTQEGCYLKKESRQKFFELYEGFIPEIREKIKDELRNFVKNLSEG